MKHADFEEIRTKRLVLRKLRLEDACCYYERIGSSEDVTRFMLWQPHKTLRETCESIEKVMGRYEKGNAYTWGIALAEDNSVIGRIDLLRIDEAECSCSFAYMLGKDFWGRGYGTEALNAVLAFAFEQMQMQRICADHMTENAASGSVMRKCGMKFVETLPSKYEKGGKLFDADVYVITSEMWENRCE